MQIIEELVGYAKANAEAARTKDERMTWAAHHRHTLAAIAKATAYPGDHAALLDALHPTLKTAEG